MRSRQRSRGFPRSRRGFAALGAVLLIPAIFAVAGLAVDAGHLYVQVHKVRAACQSAALAAFEYSFSEAPAKAAPVGTAALRLAGFSTGSITVAMNSTAGRPPVATATAQGISVKTFFVGALSNDSWTWTLNGVRAKATRKPMVVSLVMDASGSMCNSNPVVNIDYGVVGSNPNYTKPFLDMGDGMMPRQFYERLRNAGGMDYLSVKTVNGVKYREVPVNRMWSAQRDRTCTANTAKTWFQDYVREAKRFVRSHLVEGYDSVGIISFNWGANEKMPVTPVSYAAVDAVLNALTAGGPSNLADAIRKATDQILASPADAGRVHRNIVLFTDGAANVMHAVFTDVSSDARASDPAFRYDPASPSADSPPSYVVPASTLGPPGLGSIYADAVQPAPREYVVWFNPSAFERWVFEKINPSDPEITLAKLKLADCAGAHYLHKFTPAEPPRGYPWAWAGPWEATHDANQVPTYGPPEGGLNLYGTYAIERCFDSYAYQDWDGQHAPPTGGNLTIPTGAPVPVSPDNRNPYPYDPFIQYYHDAGAKMWGDFYHHHAYPQERDWGLQPQRMALYEANRAKSPPNNISVHTLSYGYYASLLAYIKFDYPALGFDDLAVRVGGRGFSTSGYHGPADKEDWHGYGLLDELTNYADSHWVDGIDPEEQISAWDEQSRGYTLAFTPSPVWPPATMPPDWFAYWLNLNLPANDTVFLRHAQQLFGSLARQTAALTSDS